MKDDKRYRIIERKIYDMVVYNVEVKGLFFWYSLTHGQEDDIMDFDSIEKAEKEIEKRKLGKSERIVKEL